MAQRGEEISGIGGDAAGQLPAELSNSGSSSPNLDVSSLNLTVSTPNLPEVRDRDIHHDMVSRSASRKAARNGIATWIATWIATLCRDIVSRLREYRFLGVVLFNRNPHAPPRKRRKPCKITGLLI